MKTISVYKFTELKEAAKATAINKFLNEDREFWQYYEIKASIKDGLNFFGFGMGCNYSIDFGSANNSDADVTSNHYYDAIQDLKGIRLFKYIQNNYENILISTSENSCPFTGVCYDENFLDGIREFMQRPSDITFHELMENCCRKVFDAMEQEYDYFNSDEFAAQELDELDCDFLEDGRRI